MTTKFDIGDKVKLTVEGTVKSYSVDGSGDCYVIEIPEHNKRNKTISSIRLYFETEALDACGASKVEDNS